MHSTWLHRFVLVAALCTLVLVVEGALATSNAGAIYATGHRHLGMAIMTLMMVQSVWIGWVSKDRTLRWLGIFALAVSILTGILGLAHWSPVLHACLAQVLFSTIVAIWVLTTEDWSRDAEIVRDGGTPSLRSLAFSVPVFILIQIALGAGYRHHAIGAIPHILGAFLVMGIALMVSIFTLAQHAAHRNLRESSLAVLFGMIAQVLLGIGAYMSRDTLVTVGHVAVGTLTMAASVVLALHVAKNVRQYTILQMPSRGMSATS